MSDRGRVRSRISLVAGGGYRLGQLRPYGSCALGQTDGQTDGRIAVSLNAPYGGGHNNATCLHTVCASCNVVTLPRCIARLS